MDQQISQILSLVLDQVAEFQAHKKELIQIVIDKNITDDEKLDKLEDNILEFQAKPCPKVDAIVAPSDQKPDQSNLMHLNDLGTLLKTVTEPSRDHGELLESIGGVLKNDEINSQSKIKNIRKLLL